MIDRRQLVLAIPAVAIVGAIAASWLPAPARPEATLAEASALAGVGRLDEAGAKVAELLRRRPGHDGANLLAAQIALGRDATEESPGLDRARTALEHLARVRTEDRPKAALACLLRGNAEHRLGRLDAAESSWLEAIRIEPTVPEAGWALLNLYYLELRPDDARRLALRLHETEPDRRDRVQLLLELLRQDVQPPAPESLVIHFEPIVGLDPAGVRPRLALGLALVRSGEAERGVPILRAVAEARPDRPESWSALLAGLDEAGQVDEIARVVGRLPEGLAGSPRWARFRARVAQERGDWAAAAADYRVASRDDPADPRLTYRLARVLQRLGATAEAEALDRRHRDQAAASAAARALYERADADKTLGVDPHPDLYREVADLREAMGRADEALAWQRLALGDSPGDPASLAAVARLAPGAGRPDVSRPRTPPGP